MLKLKKFFSTKSHDIVIIFLLVVSVLVIPYFYKASVVRILDAIKDFLLSLAFYFCSFWRREVKVSVTQMPSLDVLDYLPYDFDEIFRRLKDMWGVVFNSDCFKSYMVKIVKVLNDFSMYVMLLLPILICVGILLRSYIVSPNRPRYLKIKRALKYILFSKKQKEKKRQKYLFYLLSFFKTRASFESKAFQILLKRDIDYLKRLDALDLLLAEIEDDESFKGIVRESILASDKIIKSKRKWKKKRKEKIKALTYILVSQNNHGKKTKSLIFFENKILPKLSSVYNWFKALFTRFKDVKWYFYPIVIVWLLNLNILTISLEALAYYFYFAMSQDVLNLLTIQFGKLLLDLVIMFSGAPLLFWLICAYKIICLYRTNKGFATLDKIENACREFLKKLPFCILFRGLMGSKKTTTLTDTGVSTEIMFRDKAFELLLEQDCKFPNFPWIKFEDSIKQAMESHKVYSLTTCRKFVDERRKHYENNPESVRIWGYDVKKYRDTYANELEVMNIWDVLKNYAQLYFMYIIQSSYLISSYSVRVDNVLEHAGNFPLWNTELFRRKPEMVEAVSRHAHILNQDTLRIGKTMVKNTPHRGTFEFGIILVSEIGKERGNKVTNDDKKKSDETANQKNDLYSYSLKMIRHKSTVCNFCFARLLSDEQRLLSLEADLRELLDIVYIKKSGDFELVMPCFFITELFHDFLYPRFKKLYIDYRYNRGDMSLLMYFLHNAFSAFHNYYTNIYNLFGVCELDVELEHGTQDGEKIETHYWISSKKAYSKRFTTDCYALFFEKILLSCTVGIDDLPEYAGVIPTYDEYLKQNSYFISDMIEKT